MPKILSQSGISLADMYDVEGSIAGVEQLDQEDVKVVHDLGDTIFSERLSGGMNNTLVSGAIAQDTNFDAVLDLGAVSVVRILNAIVLADAARIENAMLAVRDAETGEECPFWHFDTNGSVDTVLDIRIDEGAGAGNAFILRPGATSFPSMLLGNSQAQPITSIAFRGRSTGFGAGTVAATATVNILFAQVGGLSSFGVPVPSW